MATSTWWPPGRRISRAGSRTYRSQLWSEATGSPRPHEARRSPTELLRDGFGEHRGYGRLSEGLGEHESIRKSGLDPRSAVTGRKDEWYAQLDERVRDRKDLFSPQIDVEDCRFDATPGGGEEQQP